jgi:hypothetical protein
MLRDTGVCPCTKENRVTQFASSMCVVILAAAGLSAHAQPAAPQGAVKGNSWQHTASSAQAAIARAAVVLPASATGGAVFVGTFADTPRGNGTKVPVVVFLHGSSGLSLKAIADWQAWLAGLGVASIAPDSFALPERLTYTSPVDKETYEKIHALRQSEIGLALEALKSAPWADSARLILAGTSEGATSVARYPGSEFAAKMIYSWSCENNYFVTEHRSVFLPDRPVLNVMSSTDVFFSPSNGWLANPLAKGHCAEALKDHKAATIVLIPGAPHTLLNLPAARHATAGFIADLRKP